MTAAELKDRLPTAQYPDLIGLEQDIRRALRLIFPGHDKIERDTLPLTAVPEPGKPLDAMMLFRPEDTGVAYYIRIVDGKVESVFEGGSKLD